MVGRSNSFFLVLMVESLFQEECTGPLRELTDKINRRPRHPDVLSDAYLSMFILAELHVNMPEAHTSPSSGTNVSSTFWLLLASIGLVLLMTCDEEQPALEGLASLKLFSLRIPKLESSKSFTSSAPSSSNSISDVTT